VLTDISFHIHPGERVALTGPSGIGKTTVINLILQFYRSNLGDIYVDGQPAADFDTASLRRRIGYVAQNPQFLSASVLENLRFGAPDADRDQITRAARTAAIHDFIETLPQKYETIIGANGPNLSEGQKQRLSIARALAKKPDILILDEPTAALDQSTEKSIFDLLPSQLNGTTVLLVSHRRSTLMRADRILLLNEKGIADISPGEVFREAADCHRAMAAS
jgi:ABC-type multidrug transport system fused ATPase/permease subunit